MNAVNINNRFIIMFVSVRGEKKGSGFGSRNSHVIPVDPGLGDSGSFTEGKVVGSRMGGRFHQV